MSLSSAEKAFEKLGLFVALARRYESLTDSEKESTVRQYFSLLQVVPVEMKRGDTLEIAELLREFYLWLQQFDAYRSQLELRAWGEAKPPAEWTNHYRSRLFRVLECNPSLQLETEALPAWVAGLRALPNAPNN